MYQLVAGIAAAVALVAGSYFTGRNAGYDNGYSAGTLKGYEDATRVLNATHRSAIAELNQKAADAQLAEVTRMQKERDEQVRQRDAAVTTLSTELARIASERDNFGRRVRDLLRAAAGNSHQGRDRGLPGTAVTAVRAPATPAGGVLLDGIGEGLAGLASAADATLAQYAICYRLAATQKRQLVESVPAAHRAVDRRD